MTVLDACLFTLLHHTAKSVRLISEFLGVCCVGSTARWLITSFAAGLILLMLDASCVSAQSQRGYEVPSHPLPRPAQTATPPGEPAGSSLPTWAEPQRSSSFSSGRGNGSSLDAPATKNGPGLPDNPNRVPLGGIEWLMLAGAGYGAFRLRKADAPD